MCCPALLYNLAMAVADLAALTHVLQRPGAAAWCRALIGAGVLAVLFALMFGITPFRVFGLAAFGLFLHGTLLLTLSRVPRSWTSGMTELPRGGRLLVSRGIGMERSGAPPLRFLCRPELVVVDLVPRKE